MDKPTIYDQFAETSRYCTEEHLLLFLNAILWGLYWPGGHWR